MENKRLSTRMKALGWTIIQSGTSWIVTTQTGREYTFTNGRWDNQSELDMVIKLHEKLQRFDWTYRMSDDGRVYRRGEQQVHEILTLCKNIQHMDQEEFYEHQNIYIGGHDKRMFLLNLPE